MKTQEHLLRLGVEPFRPNPIFSNPHAQTIAPALFLAKQNKKSERFEVVLKDGDCLIGTIDRPREWKHGDRVALLVHGLAGSESSPYMIRLSKDLTQMGILVVRLNLRGCGPGFGKARKTYHAGQSEDLREVVSYLGRIFPRSPLTQIGFSLGGNIALKMAGEDSGRPTANLDSVIAVSSPLDLSASCQQMGARAKFYDQFFVLMLRAELARQKAKSPDFRNIKLPLQMSLAAFDHLYTAVVNEFESGEDYYQKCSAGQFVPHIKVKGLSIFSYDDPVIDAESYRKQVWPDSMTPILVENGGHVGFMSASILNPWWANEVIVKWIETSLD